MGLGVLHFIKVTSAGCSSYTQFVLSERIRPSDKDQSVDQITQLSTRLVNVVPSRPVHPAVPYTPNTIVNAIF
jgi:hypothetical protein